MKTKYQTENFYGTVILKDWCKTIQGRNVQRLTGLLTLVRDEDYVGFKTRGTEANWAMRVVGPSEAWTILGCQIRAIVAHDAVFETSCDDAHTVL